MKPKVFTLEEAHQILPKLVPLIHELKEKRQTMMEMHDQLLTAELLHEKNENFYETEEGKEYLTQSSSLENLIMSFEEDLQGLTNLGCLLRDIEKGIVDFYHVSNKELVFLNWLIGEKSINFWHELDASYLERLPLDQLGTTNK